MNLGLYKHYKGNTYKVLGVAKHSETQEELVVYQDVTDQNKLWVRPKSMFLEDIVVDGKSQPRFQWLGE